MSLLYRDGMLFTLITPHAAVDIIRKHHIDLLKQNCFF